MFAQVGVVPAVTRPTQPDVPMSGQVNAASLAVDGLRSLTDTPNASSPSPSPETLRSVPPCVVAFAVALQNGSPVWPPPPLAVQGSAEPGSWASEPSVRG